MAGRGTNLGESDLLGALAEALTADVNAVLQGVKKMN